MNPAPAATCAILKLQSSWRPTHRADLETREHELENPEPQNGQDAAIDYEALAAVKTDLAKQREKLPACS